MSRLAKSQDIALKSGDMPPGIAGQLIKTPADRIVIRVNRTLNKSITRYIVAHEFAHFMLHRRVLDDSPYHWIQDDLFFKSPVIPQWMEEEAHQLAMEILMPHDLLSRELDGQDIIDHQDLVRLADLCQVTLTRMQMRLGAFSQIKEIRYAC